MTEHVDLYLLSLVRRFAAGETLAPDELCAAEDNLCLNETRIGAGASLKEVWAIAPDGAALLERALQHAELRIAYHKANAHRCLTEHLSEFSARAGDFSLYAERDEARRALQAAEDALKTAGLDP